MPKLEEVSFICFYELNCDFKVIDDIMIEIYMSSNSRDQGIPQKLENLENQRDASSRKDSPLSSVSEIR